MNYFLLFLSILSFKIDINAYNLTSTCYCTTVPCPIEGKNLLTIGGGTNATEDAGSGAHGGTGIVIIYYN